MNVSYEWLRALVPVDETPAQLAALITARVTTVDDVVPLREDLAPIVVARVVEERPHPDSDHLHLTKVDMGTGTLIDVVCGAHNVTAGKLYPFAPVGTTMPNGLKIQKRKIRGETSEGMLCSPDELLLGDDHSGIMELSVDVPPGTPFLRAFPVGDARIVVDVAANRPDLLSHLGVAREVAAATGKPLALPAVPGASVDSPSLRSSVGMTIRVEDQTLVRRFMGVAIRGVKVGPSPEWLVKRIQSVGGRSINNVVDASNYVLHELGQPTHAFDLAKMGGGTSVVVRLARAGERITTLDGHERTLTPEMIVIADAERPQAVAGVMGGRDSEVTDSTTDIFLEVANFDPRRVRNARRALGLTTDASYRFERGVDVEIAPQALERVASIITTLAGGQVDGAPFDLVTTPIERRTLTLRESRVAAVLGERIPLDQIERLLSSIGFESAKGEVAGAVRVVVPSWRTDVITEIDLVEEVARLHGYDAFPVEIRPFRAGNVPDDPQWITSRRIRETLVGAGLMEVRAMPFVRGGHGFIRVENPLAENEAYLRRELLDTLARRAEYNLAHMQGDLRLFEIGSIFLAEKGQALPREELHAAALVMGRRMPSHFTDPKSEDFATWARYDAWDARALGESLARSAYPGRAIQIVSADGGGPVAADALAVAMPESAVAWAILVDGERLGRIGRVVLDAPVWASPMWGVELSLGVIESAEVAPRGQNAHRPPVYMAPPVAVYRPIPTAPAAEFDLALNVPVSVSAAQVEDVVRRASGELLERIALFDLYEGKGVEPGHRSLAWRLTFRHPERTLRDKEIEGRRAKIVSVLQTELNVRPRTS